MDMRKRNLFSLWLLILVGLGACLAQESDGPTGNKLANLDVDVQIMPPQDPDVFDQALDWYITAQVGADPIEVDGTLCGRLMAPMRNVLLRVPKRSGPLTLRVHVVGLDGQYRALGSGEAALMEVDVALTVNQWSRKSGPWVSPCLNGGDGGSNTPDLPLPQPDLQTAPDMSCGAGLGQECYKGVGACQQRGRLVCDGPQTVKCEAVPGQPNETPQHFPYSLPGGGQTWDHNCDGKVEMKCCSGLACNYDCNRVSLRNTALGSSCYLQLWRMCMDGARGDFTLATTGNGQFTPVCGLNVAMCRGFITAGCTAGCTNTWPGGNCQRSIQDSIYEGPLTVYCK